MPKLGKRKRDERRLGKPVRLADIALARDVAGWTVSPWIIHSGNRDVWQMAWESIARVRRTIAGCSVIVADNVGTYFYEHPQQYWTYREDFPNSAPPFSSFFIELGRPGRLVLEDGDGPPGDWMPDRWGFLFSAVDAGSVPYISVLPSGEMVHREVVGARWYLKVELITAVGLKPDYPGFLKWFPVGEHGEILEDPPSGLLGPHLPSEDRKEIGDTLACLFPPALLALSFLNCKNTTLRPVEPDPEINRERRAAHLAPFVRYHTIDIEPMRRVLGTEGRVGEVGLRRALHLVRGHFATYTPDRPLFGKVAGTFWVPSHVRGSAERGAVISDYRIGDATHGC